MDGKAIVFAGAVGAGLIFLAVYQFDVAGELARYLSEDSTGGKASQPRSPFSQELVDETAYSTPAPMPESGGLIRSIDPPAIDLCRATSKTLKPDDLFWGTASGIERCYWSVALAAPALSNSGQADCTATPVPAPAPAETSPPADETANSNIQPKPAVPCVQAPPPNLFFLASANARQVILLRYKLNTNAVLEPAHLSELASDVDVLHRMQNWTVPPGLDAAILAGRNINLFALGINYRFLREDGALPRYNFVMEFVPLPGAELGTTSFEQP